MNLRLTTKLIRARSLKAMDYNGKSDPYCKLKLSTGGPTLRSKIVDKELNPVWNDLFHFPVLDPSTECLEIDCFDSNLVAADNLIGTTVIPLHSLPFGPVNLVEQWFPIYERYPAQGSGILPQELGNPTGELQLELTLETEVLVPKPFVCHSSTVVGGLVGSLGEGFCTYEVGMWHVGLLLGSQYQSFNAKYDKAQQIFGNDPKAAMARKTIRVQHAELYRQGWARSKGGSITTGEDFLKLLNYGERQGSRRMFTYVLMDDALFFSETGASFFKDFMSKHATHSNASPKVRYAGEFQVRRDPFTGGHVFVIDNNSGTYAPDKSLLSNLAELFTLNFPGLMVQALHFEDPLLKQYRAEYDEERTKKLQHQHEQSLTYRLGKALGLTKQQQPPTATPTTSTPSSPSPSSGDQSSLAASLENAFSYFPSSVPSFQTTPGGVASMSYVDPSSGVSSSSSSAVASPLTTSPSGSGVFYPTPYSLDPYHHRDSYHFSTGEFITPSALMTVSSSDPLGLSLIPPPSLVPSCSESPVQSYSNVVPGLGSYFPPPSSSPSVGPRWT